MHNCGCEKGLAGHKSAVYSVQEETDKSDHGDENTEGGEKIESSDRVDACEEDCDDKGAGVGQDQRQTHSSLT